MARDPSHPAFTFIGSPDKIRRDEALVSEFRRQHGMNPDPYGAIVGTPQDVERKLALLEHYKSTL